MKTILFIILFLPTISFAKGFGLIFEPSFGANKGVWKEKMNSEIYNATISGDTLDLEIAAKLLLKLDSVLFGMEYSWSRVRWMYKKSETTRDDTWLSHTNGSMTNLSAILGGLNKKGIFSYWVGYIFKSKVSLNENIKSNFSAPTYTGNGFKAGFGFRLDKHRRIRLNITGAYITHEKLNQGGSSISLPGTVEGASLNQQSHKSFGVSMSYPFSILGRGR